jgi:hypothetical protein
MYPPIVTGASQLIRCNHQTSDTAYPTHASRRTQRPRNARTAAGTNATCAKKPHPGCGNDAPSSNPDTPTVKQ